MGKTWDVSGETAETLRGSNAFQGQLSWRKGRAGSVGRWLSLFTGSLCSLFALLLVREALGAANPGFLRGRKLFSTFCRNKLASAKSLNHSLHIANAHRNGATETKMKHTILLYVQNNQWVAKHSHPTLVTELFGTDTLPTPFGSKTECMKVLARITELNPECEVLLA